MPVNNPQTEPAIKGKFREMLYEHYVANSLKVFRTQSEAWCSRNDITLYKQIKV